ncbi:hypothetical protein TNCV_957601 [Trichonephila clavipes]|nr:hypothetical protein TNCV_957601 [Trichonephila clavipes]
MDFHSHKNKAPLPAWPWVRTAGYRPRSTPMSQCTCVRGYTVVGTPCRDTGPLRTPPRCGARGTGPQNACARNARSLHGPPAALKQNKGTEC